jgi:hypothetical protein
MHLHIRIFIAITLAVSLCSSLSGAEEKPSKFQRKPLEFWIKQLDSYDAKERELVMEAISTFEADAAPALPVLIEMLDDQSPEY